MKSEINALWARVRSLQRKLARELAAYRLDLLSRDLCHRWFVAQSDQKPLPEIQAFIIKVIDAGYRLLPLGAANNYLRDCRRKDIAPDPERCSMSSFPRSRISGLRGPLAEGRTGTTLHMPRPSAPQLERPIGRCYTWSSGRPRNCFQPVIPVQAGIQGLGQ